MIKQPRDRRPESFRPLDESELVAAGRLGTADGWRARREVLERGVVHERLRPLLDGAKANELSLATFKPARITDFLIEPDMDRDWDEARVRKMREGQNQFHLWEDNEWRRTFELVQKVPSKFRYRFEDADGVSSRLRILDWELGQLYWNCLRAADGHEERALEKVRAKYFDEIAKTKDVHLFLGTIYAFHGRSENPWSIVGVFYPPVTKQLRLSKSSSVEFSDGKPQRHGPRTPRLGENRQHLPTARATSPNALARSQRSAHRRAPRALTRFTPRDASGGRAA